MIKQIAFSVLLTCLTISSLLAQKPVIDTATFNNWPVLNGDAMISSTGKYVYYSTYVAGQKKSTTFLKSTSDNWSKQFSPSVDCKFLSDGKRLVFSRRDTLYFLTLGTDHYTFVPKVDSYEMIHAGNNECVLYKQEDVPGHSLLHIRDARTDKDVVLKEVADYYFQTKSNFLLLVRNYHGSDSSEIQSFSWYDLSKNKEEYAFQWKGEHFKPIFNKNMEQFCFISEDTVDDNKQLFFYKRGMTSPIVLMDNKRIEHEYAGVTLTADESPIFNKNTRYIFFTVKVKSNTAQPSNNRSGLTVWKYSDQYMPPEQPFIEVGEYRWSVSIDTKKIVELEDQEDRLRMDPQNIGDYAIQVTREPGSLTSPSYWQKDVTKKCSLISLKDGSKKIIDTNIRYSDNFFLSPDNNYVIYFNPFEQNYFCFNTADGSTKNITASINTEWCDKESQGHLPVPALLGGFGVASWVKDEPSVLIYSQFDIWKIDLKGEKATINITSHNEAKNHFIIRLVESESNDYSVLSPKDEVLLYAFDPVTKATGFCKKKLLSDNISFQSFTMDAYSYGNLSLGSIAFPKATSVNCWLVTRESAGKSSNIFITEDFKSFRMISDVAPEKNYNWLTSELVTWQLPDGKYNQGILYKPENFDSTKKYPVVFTYYELRTNELNKFKIPNFLATSYEINVPYFVSNGYLVFIPDIHYTMGKPGESAATTFVSAADHLSNLPWVDGKRIAIQGFSYGGYETIYTITHSHLFAAACEGSGFSDVVSMFGGAYQYGSIPYFWASLFCEIGQGRIGASLPEAPDLYIKASPVLRTAQVSTPLLMMHNKGDSRVSFTQAMEFFTGLRRMGKRVWLLEYKTGGHGLNDADGWDYSVRMKQFFDHYLKGASVPKWMLEDGEDSEELDPNAKEPEQKEVLYQGVFQKVRSDN